MLPTESLGALWGYYPTHNSFLKPQPVLDIKVPGMVLKTDTHTQTHTIFYSKFFIFSFFLFFILSFLSVFFAFSLLLTLQSLHLPLSILPFSFFLFLIPTSHFFLFSLSSLLVDLQVKFRKPLTVRLGFCKETQLLAMSKDDEKHWKDDMHLGHPENV